MSLEKLLEDMLTLNEEQALSLENTKETWARIGSLDSFSELMFSSEEEKEEFLKDWIENNDYSNI